jgi:hypothetical protein
VVALLALSGQAVLAGLGLAAGALVGAVMLNRVRRTVVAESPLLEVSR